MTYTFDHIGIPTDVIHPNEKGGEEQKQYYTDSKDSPLHIEYLRFLPGCDGPEMLMKTPHIAFCVESIAEAVKEMDSVVLGPFGNGVANIAFCMKDGLLLELMKKI